MRLIFIGPPGSGKGTQAKLFSQRENAVHVSTGDILRDAVEKDTPEGRKAKVYMNAGQLVPDEIVNDIVSARFRGAGKPHNFILDGYPRNVAQARQLDQVLADKNLPLDAVVVLDVEDDEIVHRLGNRWTCPNTMCKAVYHTVFKPPKVEGVCDLCGTSLYQRDDDKPATIRKRLQVYHGTHDELLQHYDSQGLIREVPGHGDVEAIYAAIKKALGQ